MNLKFILQKLSTNIFAFATRYPILIISLAVLITYVNILLNGFVWDDEEQIVNNILIHSLKNFNLFLYGGTFNTGGAGELSGWFFRPLINITFAFLYSIFGASAWGYHLFSLLFHLLNTILFFKVLEKFNDAINKTSKIIPLLLALIFAVHPGILEAVSYISAVADLAVAFSALAVTYIILTFGNRKSVKYQYIAGFLILFGLLYKESALAILPIIISLLLIFRKEIVNLKMWFLAITLPYIIYFILRIPVAQQPIQAPHFAPIAEASLTERLITIPSVIYHYMRLLFYPHILAVSQHFVVKQVDFKNFVVPLAILVAIMLALGLVYTKSRHYNRHILLFGIIWSICSFGLISNIVPLDMTVAERWFYFPIIGMLIICYILINSLSKFIYQIVIFILSIAIIFLSTTSIKRNFDWKNGLTLYSKDIAKNPESFDLNNNIGVELYRTNQKEKAKYYFEKSIQLQPKWHFAYNNLGVTYDDLGDYAKAEELFKSVLNMSDYHLAHVNLCRLYTLKIKNYELGEKSCEESVKKLPNNSQLWFFLAIAKYQNNKYEEALQIAEALKNAVPSEETYYLYEKISRKEKLDNFLL